MSPSHLRAKTNPGPQLQTIHPHRDNLPRRTRTKTIPLQISISQSTIGPQPIDPSQHPDPLDAHTDQAQLSPDPPPLRLNSKALSLISKAQNRAFNPGLSNAAFNRPPSLNSPTSPQLPHPAMGLTMGIMEAYAREDEDKDEPIGIDHPLPPRAILRHGLSYSPVSAVKGTPPALPSLPFQTHTPPLVPVPESRPMPSATLTVPNSISVPNAPTPSPALTPPITAPLGQNLPRRHRFRRRLSHPEEGVPESGETSGEISVRVVKEKQDTHVLRLERIQPHKNENLEEGSEAADGLFSSLLDFQRGISGVSQKWIGSSKREGGTESHLADSDLAGSRGSRRRTSRNGEEEDPRCIQVLGRSCVEVGYMHDEGREDYLLVEVVDGCDDNDVEEEDRKQSRRFEIQLAAVCEGVPSLSPVQVAAGCDFMKAWIGPGYGERKRKVRISVPRRRPQDAFGLAVCFLAWIEDQQEQWVVPLKTNDIDIEYTSIHRLYMRLLDDGEGKSNAHSDLTLTGLRDEWRGVLSYEGLNTLVGVWP